MGSISMKSLTGLNRLRRPAVGAFIVLTLASSAVGWTAGTVAASSGPQASLVGGATTGAAHHELGTVSNDGSNTPSGDQGAAGPSDTTLGSSNAGPGTNAGPAAGSDTGPVNDGPVTDPSTPDLLVPDVDYGQANTPSGDQGADCSTVTSPGSTDAPSDDQGTVCSTDTTPGSTDASPGANADPGTDPGIDAGNPGTDPGIDAGNPEPYQLVPDVDYSGTTTPSGDQGTAGSTDTTPGSTDAGTDAVGL
jgi:hypothetical protein